MLLHKNEHDSTEIPPPPYTEDDDYDVFLFYPSQSPRLLIPVNEPVENPYRLTKHRQQLDHVLPSYSLSSSLESTSVAHVQTVDGLELETAGDLLSPPSPTWTFVSDFEFPQAGADDVLSVAGYSRAFRDGLFSKSRQLTRRLGVVRRKLAKIMGFFKLKR